MRVSQETMAGHRRAVITAAASLFRKKGIAAVSIADVMQTAGLTHGGFYRHFDSKDALAAAAIEAAFTNYLDVFRKLALRKGEARALAIFVRVYLSRQHVLTPEKGCPAAALVTEAPREGQLACAAFSEGWRQVETWIAGGLNAGSAGRASPFFCLLVGAVVSARAMAKTPFMNGILASAREEARRLLL